MHAPLVLRPLRRIVPFAAFSLAALAATACGGAAPTTGPSGSGSAPAAGSGAPPVNRVVLITEPVQRSALEMRQVAEPNMWPLRAMYDDLILIDAKTGKFAPGVATSWAFEGDGTAFRLKLREGLKFHGGYGDVQAQDIAFALQRLMLPDSPHGQGGYFRGLMKDAEVVNDHELVLRLNRPDGQLVAAISEQQSGLEAQSRANFEKTGAATWQTGPLAGSGPYQWLEGQDGQYLRFRRTEWTHPFRTRPGFPELEIRYAKEPSTRQAALLSGEAHLSALPTDLMVQAEKQGMRIQSSVFPGLRVFGDFKCCFIKDPKNPTGGFLYPDSAMMDVRVRKALQKAVNLDELNKALFGGQGQQMSQPHMHPSRPGWDPSWDTRFKDEYGYDPEAAKKLLAEAGKPNPKVSLLLTPVAGAGVAAGDVAEAVAGYWRKVGVDVDIDNADPATIDKGNLALKWDRHVDFRGTASNIWSGYGLYNSTAQSRSSVEDPEIERLLGELRLTVDEQKQDALWRQVGEFTFRQHLDLNMFWLPVRIAVNPKVVGDWVFPGTITGSWTHLENIAPLK